MINRKGKKIAALLTAFVMAATCFAVDIVPAYADTDDPQISDLPDAVLAVGGSLAENGKAKNGFLKDYTYFTQTQLDGITSEETADSYFSSTTYDSYDNSTVFSARRRVGTDGWGQMQVVRGLNLKAMADSLGVSTAGTVPVYYKATDGYSTTYDDIWASKYRFATATSAAGTGVAVDPILALEGKYATAFNGHASGSSMEIPRLMIGQSNALTDYNAQYMGYYIKEFDFGTKETALTVNNNGTNRTLSIADIVVGAKNGASIDRKRAVYTYENASDETCTATVTGVRLSDLLENLGLPTTSGNIYTVTNADGTVTKTINLSQANNYFVAYEGSLTENGSMADLASKNTDSELMLYSPGTATDSESDIVMYNFNKLTLTSTPPAAPSSLAAAKYSYNRIKLTWPAVSGASGYYIDRYNYDTKKWTSEIYDTLSGSTTSWTDSGLKTGTYYKYRIRAYKTINNAEVTGTYRESNSIKPTLGKAYIRRLKKSGSTSIKVYWKKVSGASGYRIYYGTNKKITKNKKTATVKKGSTLSKTVKKMKRGRKYYFKIRAYRTVNGKRIYGPYSSVKSLRR